jgi:hypothetical protein
MQSNQKQVQLAGILSKETNEKANSAQCGRGKMIGTPLSAASVENPVLIPRQTKTLDNWPTGEVYHCFAWQVTRPFPQIYITFQNSD